MNEAQFASIADWLAKAGLAGEDEVAIVTGFCERAVAAGLPLARTHVLVDTLHPVHEGRLFRWGHDPKLAPTMDYGRTQELPAIGPLGETSMEDAERKARKSNIGAAVRSTGCCRPAIRCCIGG